MLVNDILVHGGRLSNILQLINSKTPTVDIYSQNETGGKNTNMCPSDQNDFCTKVTGGL